MKQVYLESIPFAKRPARNFSGELDALCRQKISEVVQAYLEVEVDDLLQRLRYERAGGELIGYRDGHDPQRTITTLAAALVDRTLHRVLREAPHVPCYEQRRSRERSPECPCPVDTGRQSPPESP